jgi:hypothetical protein
MDDLVAVRVMRQMVIGHRLRLPGETVEMSAAEAARLVAGRLGVDAVDAVDTVDGHGRAGTDTDTGPDPTQTAATPDTAAATPDPAAAGAGSRRRGRGQR